VSRKIVSLDPDFPVFLQFRQVFMKNNQHFLFQNRFIFSELIHNSFVLKHTFATQLEDCMKNFKTSFLREKRRILF